MPSKGYIQKSITKPLPEGIEFIDGNFVRRCPNCGTAQTYKRRDHALRMLRLGTVCNTCRAERRGCITGQHRGVSRSYFKQKELDAVARAYEFDLTIDDVADLLEAQNYRCALTDAPIAIDKSTGNSGSLDRIDNSKGYTKDNIQLVTAEINMLRGSFTMERFRELCELVVNG